MTIIEKLKDLLLQATTERSHYYVASVTKEAIAGIEALSESRDYWKREWRLMEAAETAAEKEIEIRSASWKEAAAKVEELLIENKRLEAWIDDLQSGMWINCVYCGHRYGPNDDKVAPRKALEEHIESCPKHPLSIARAELRKRCACEFVDGACVSHCKLHGAMIVTGQKMQEEIRGYDVAMAGANAEIDALKEAMKK